MMTMQTTTLGSVKKKTSKKPILYDADGVLVNWNTGFKTWMATRGYKEVTSVHYDMSKRYNLTPEQITELIREYNCSAAVSYLFPMPGAVLINGMIRELGYEPYCITSFGGDTFSQLQRAELLWDYFRIEPKNTIILPMNVNKKHILSRWEGSGAPWVEDKLENALDGHALGLKAILLRSDHTKDYVSDTISVAENWFHIYDIITGEETCHTCPTNGSSSI
jgi:hypothetical protein